MRIIKGRDYAIPYQIVSNGKSVDITGYEITFTVKEDRDSNTVKIEKKNTAAGGGDSEVKILDASNGFVVVYIDRSDTLNLNSGTIFIEVYATDGTEDYNILGIREVIDSVNKTGDSAEDISVIANKTYEAAIASDGTETVSTESSWDGDITPSRISTGLYHITSSSEFASNKTEIEVQKTETGLTITKEHYSSSLIKIRVYDAQGALYDSAFVITIKVY